MRAPLGEGSKSPSAVPPGEQFILAVDAWLQWLEHNRGRSGRTVEKYRGYLVRLARWCADEGAIAPASTSNPFDLTAKDLENFCGLYAHQAGIAPRSRRPMVAAVRNFFAWHARQTRAKRSVAEDLAYPSYGRPLPVAISLEEAERMLMTPDIETFLGLRNVAMIMVLLGAGLRVSGLQAMNESSLLWAVDEHGIEQLTVRVTEKGKKDRLVPLPHEAALIVRAYLGHPDLEAIDRNVGVGDRVLWVSTNNHIIGPHEYHGERRRISVRTIAQMLERVGKRAKVPRAHRNPHAFRHLYGTELTESGVPTLTVQALMGHVNAKDTEIYTRLAARTMRKAAEQGNPIAKMGGSLLGSLRAIGATQRQARASAAPSGAYNRQTRNRPKAGE